LLFYLLRLGELVSAFDDQNAKKMSFTVASEATAQSFCGTLAARPTPKQLKGC
jgi:hypothetical protein